MIPLVTIGLAVICVSIYFAFRMQKGGAPDVSWVKHLGTVALSLGVLGQCVGLYGAFLAIEEWGGVSPKILFAGFRVSSITTISGLVIFVGAYILWMLLKLLQTKLSAVQR